MKALEAAALAAAALSGDLKAGDEEPTHFSSWFVLCDALAALSRIEVAITENMRLAGERRFFLRKNRA